MEPNLMKDAIAGAIADAKAVRAVALANAKASLEEALTPRFQAMFAEKLKTEANQEMENTGDVENRESQTSENEIDQLIKELESDVEKDETGMDNNLESPESSDVPSEEPSPEEGGEPLKAGDTVVLQKVPSANTELPEPSPEGEEPAPEMPDQSAEGEEEVNLDELLESLKEETMDEDEEDECIKEEVPVKTSGIGTTLNKKPSSSAHDCSHIDNGDNPKDAETSFPDGGKLIGKDPSEIPMGNKNFGNNKKGSLEKTPKLTKENIDGNGIPGGKSVAKDPTEAPKGDKNFGDNKNGEMKDTPILKENRQLKNRLNEAETSINFLRNQLNEINMLNVKLLYTNKLLKEFDMSNDQKMKIIEMFDLTKTTREAKLTYANISESLNFGGKLKKKVQLPRSVTTITEGLASAQVGTTRPSKEIISEGQGWSPSRMQQLAGIKMKKK